MTPVQAIIVVIIRLWAASTLMTAIGMVPIIFTIIFDKHSGFADSNIYTLSTAGFWVVAGLVAWIFAPYFSRKAAPASMKEGLAVRVDADTLVMIGSFLIGGFFMVQHLPSLIAECLSIFITIAREDSSYAGGVDTFKLNNSAARLVITKMMIVALATWMMFRPVHITTFFSKLRNAGLAKVEGDDATPEITERP